MAGFQVVQQVVDVMKRNFIVIPTVQAGFQGVFADDPLRLALFRGVSAFTHEADAGNQPFVLRNELLQVWKKWFSHILLQIL